MHSLLLEHWIVSMLEQGRRMPLVLVLLVLPVQQHAVQDDRLLQMRHAAGACAPRTCSTFMIWPRNASGSQQQRQHSPACCC